MIVRLLRSALAVACASGFIACTGSSDDPSSDGRVRIVASTGMIADAARHVAGEFAEVTALMGPGVDPHLYKASQGDLGLLTNADVVFYNGLHLEGKMAETLEKLSGRKRTIPVAEAVPTDALRAPPEFSGNYDPHVWFDVRLWTHVVRAIERTMKEIDPVHADDYRRNADAYVATLDSLDRWVRDEISSIPESQRILITAHDAFGYFGAAYGIEVHGLQGISTVSEFGLADITALVDLIVARRIKAVFIESSVPKASIEAVVEGVRKKGHEIVIGGELYSDAMGEEGTAEGTYTGMVTANVNTIVQALR